MKHFFPTMTNKVLNCVAWGALAIRKFSQIAKMGLSYQLRLTRPWNLPYVYSIEATNYCNFKCDFCPQSKEYHADARDRGFLRSCIKLTFTNAR